MERKVSVKQGAESSRDETFDGEDELDYPALDDEGNGSGPISREAYIALKQAFHNLKKRYLEAEARKAELQGQLKQRDRKGSHERIYQERDELLGHLQKSYVAFKEKCGENEELKKIIQELKHKLSLKSSPEAIMQSKSGEQPGSTSVEEAKLEKKKYTSIIKELKIIGLEVVEEDEKLFIILTERDNLKKWIEEKSDGNITIVIKGTTLEDKATETEVIVTRKEDYEQTAGKRKRVEAEVIILRQKIEDQAQELNRFYKVFKEVMIQNKVLREKEQGKEIEGGKARGLPTSKPAKCPTKRPTEEEKTAFQKKTEIILSTAQEQVAEMRQVKEHLDKQNQSLRALADLTDKTTSDFVNLVNAPKAKQNFDDSRGISPEGKSPGWSEEGAVYLPQGQRNVREENFERAFSDDAPLSIAVQESNLHRFNSSEEGGESVFTQRLSGGRNFLAPSSAASSRGGEGRAVPMSTFLSESTWTGESGDGIEVIEEEEDFIGATPSRGKICPMCERFFPASYGQKEFELHVQQHFGEFV